MERIELAAVEFIFTEDADCMDVFADYITEIYDTEPEFTEIIIHGDEVWFIFEGPDFDSVEYEDEEDEIDYQDAETMVIGAIFKPSEEGADIKWIKNR